MSTAPRRCAPSFAGASERGSSGAPRGGAPLVGVPSPSVWLPLWCVSEHWLSGAARGTGPLSRSRDAVQAISALPAPLTWRPLPAWRPLSHVRASWLTDRDRSPPQSLYGEACGVPALFSPFALCVD